MNDTLQQTVVSVTERWIREVVVGLNLCPFAATPMNSGKVRYEVCVSTDQAELYQTLLAELLFYAENDQNVVPTGFLIVPDGLQDFEDYLDFVAMADEVLERAGLQGEIQIAGFHPEYCFADSEPDDQANYTNRSPYPMLHFIREDMLEDVLSRYPDPEQIPERNIEVLRRTDLDWLQAFLKN